MPAHAGPTDLNDRFVITEAKRAATWMAVAGLFGLVIVLAQPLLVIFGGVVAAALIDGGARLLDRLLRPFVRLPRSLRIVLVLILAVASLVWLATFAGTQITQQAAQMPEVVNRQVLSLIDYARAHGMVIGRIDVATVTKEALGGVGPITNVLGGILGGATLIFLALILGIYIAMEPRLYQRGIAWLLPARERGSFAITLNRMGRAMRMLMFGRVIGMAVEGLATGLLLGFYGVPMAVLLGILTGLLAFLPNIGAPISGALMVLVGFSGGTDMGLYCIFVYLVVHAVDGYVIVPTVARRTVDLAPALVLGAQLVMGVLFGLIGLILADPLVAMLKIALERQSERNENPDGEAQRVEALTANPAQA